MYKLSLALPKIAKDCRVATNHFIKDKFQEDQELQRALNSLADVAPEWRTNYPTDILEPNPKMAVSDYFFNMFYSSPKVKLTRNINIVSGLLPSPVQGILKGDDISDPYDGGPLPAEWCLNSIRKIHDMIDEDVRLGDGDRNILKKYMEYMGRSQHRRWLTPDREQRLLGRFER